MAKVNLKDTIECGRIIAQGLNALKVFNKTGNRTQFQAVMDQAETFKRKQVEKQKVSNNCGRSSVADGKKF